MEKYILITGGAGFIGSHLFELLVNQAYAPGFEDMHRRVPSIDKINRLTGYQPTYTLDEMLKSVIAYERNKLNSSWELWKQRVVYR